MPLNSVTNLPTIFSFHFMKITGRFAQSSVRSFLTSFYKKIFLLCLLLFALNCQTTLAATYSHVIIDAGHGGKDNGAKWHGVKEKDLNLQVAKTLQKALKKRGIKTTMTRSSDKYLTLQERADIANAISEKSRPLYLCLHFNAHRNQSIRGIEAFYYSEKGRVLARRFLKKISRATGLRNRGSKKRPYHVLLLTKCPAVLIECGFISNKKENKKCRSSSFQSQVVEAIAQSIPK